MYPVELRRLNEIILIEYLTQYFAQKRHSMQLAINILLFLFFFLTWNKDE